jgi:hypothetical protein
MADVDTLHDLEVRSKPTLGKDGAYIGEIRSFASPLVPEGWLECDGGEYEIKK